jgi:methyl-accepting chemotaxis protein
MNGPKSATAEQSISIRPRSGPRNESGDAAMAFLDNLKISVKILSVIALLSAVTAFVVVFGSHELSQTEQTYSALTTQAVPARTETVRFIRDMNAIGYAAYRAIAYPGDSAEAKSSATIAEQAFTRSQDTLEKVKGLDPDNANIYEGYKARSLAINEFIKRAVALGLRDENVAATQEMVKADELIASLGKDITTFNSEETKKVTSRVEATAEAAKSAIMKNYVIGFSGLLLCLGLGLWISMSKIAKPLTRLGQSMNVLAEGNLDVEIEGQVRRDEVGTMAKAVQVFKDNALALKTAEAQAAAQRQAADEERRRNEQARAEAARQVAMVVAALGSGLERLAKGDLTCRLNEAFATEYKKVQEDFNAAIGQLQETISAIVSSTREVSSAAAEISTSTTDLSQRTEEQAASLEETSASMEQISATVKKNAENAVQANQLTKNTCEVADRGGRVVSQAVSAMSRIEESSRKIADIIGVIDEIARQTNLLALNAAVEAARAGEAGRGFAVVASEVRSLAQRSSQAAKDIKDLITNSSSQVQEGVELVNRAGSSLNEIVESIKRVADIVADIANASHEQATGLDQINKALSQMDEVTQQNSALVEENAATAKTLEHQSSAMDERVGFFRVEHVTAMSEMSPAAAGASKRSAVMPGRLAASARSTAAA